MPEPTPRQAQFVREYLIDLNATQAAVRCGYSEKTANTQGPRLLHEPAIRAAIEAAMRQRADDTGVRSERVLSEIAAMAFYDPGEIMLEIGRDDPDLAAEVSVDDDGKIYGLRGPRDIRRLPEQVRRAIVGWGWDRNGRFTVKLADKSKALDQLARHLSLYHDKLELTGVDGLADRLERARSREDARADDVGRQPEKPVEPVKPVEPPTAFNAPIATGPVRPAPAPAPKPPPAVYRPVLPAEPWPEPAAFTRTDYNPLGDR